LTFEIEIVSRDKHKANPKRTQSEPKANTKRTQSEPKANPKRTQSEMTNSVALNINVHNFLRWTSIANRIDNPHLSRSQCMKNAMKELVSEKMLRSFIRTKYSEIKKQHPEYTRAECIKAAMNEWREAK